MKKLIVIMILAVAMIVYPVSSAMAYGNGGDGGGEDEATSEGTSPPGGLKTIDMSKWDAPPDKEYTSRSDDDNSSVEATRTTQEARRFEDMSPAERQMLEAAFREALTTGGGITIGYGTSKAKLVIQVAAAAAWSATTTFYFNLTSEEQSSYLYNILKDTTIAFIPVSPVSQAMIGKGVDKTKSAIQSYQHTSHGPGGYGIGHTAAR